MSSRNILRTTALHAVIFARYTHFRREAQKSVSRPRRFKTMPLLAAHCDDALTSLLGACGAAENGSLSLLGTYLHLRSNGCNATPASSFAQQVSTHEWFVHGMNCAPRVTRVMFVLQNTRRLLHGPFRQTMAREQNIHLAYHRV